MHEHVFASVSQGAANAVSRRRSLLTLTGAAVASTALGPSLTQSGKDAKKAKKRKKKKCRRQIDRCHEAIAAFCEGEESCINNFDGCCSLLRDCQAGASLDCLFAGLG